MKTIGIVGGIAWPSSIVYYRIINERIASRLGDGGLHSASLVLAQTDFQQIERNQRGVNSIGYQPGPYSQEMEVGVIKFVEWYCETMAGALEAALSRPPTLVG